MRKKSHISLARYIVRHSQNNQLQKHKMAFYLGSILPDCKPSFLYKKHEITGTFSSVEQEIIRLSIDEGSRDNMRAYFRNLGQITHYVADYFTFPHNAIYPGSLKDHCTYEEDLKLRLREYLNSGEADEKRIERIFFRSPEEIGAFILAEHKEYLQKNKNVQVDIEDIVRVNILAVAGIMDFFSPGFAKMEPVFD